MFRTSAPALTEKSMPRTRSVIVKVPSRDPRTAITFVLPATPLPPMPLPSMAATSPLTKVPWPTASVTSAPREAVSNVRPMRAAPPNSGWEMSIPVSITATERVEPPPAAASVSAARTSS